MSDVPHVTFLAAFPAIQCIKYLGDGGARIVLDIPASDEGAVESLRQWRERPLMVTVVPMAKGARETETLTDLDDATEKEPERGAPVLDRRRAAKRRDQRAGR